ncbi:EscU/YscU/HrcU family type III secretion system export apparatus switch protein [Marinicrinis lubricantis]|uniref:EscU/YscU/HrcU family type III secretion system export apparatus switch protein n=1 Tax=Marinicrinis lubricantis TaxID=2086470 RepID=A0ABW1IMH5_9BACL
MTESHHKKNVKRAAALKYDAEKQEAPILVAKGSGVTADNILKLARENGVPVQEDPSLVEVLSKLDLNQQIPTELYQLVAEVLAFIYKADQDLHSGRNSDALYEKG